MKLKNITHWTNSSNYVSLSHAELLKSTALYPINFDRIHARNVQCVCVSTLVPLCYMGPTENHGCFPLARQIVLFL